MLVRRVLPKQGNGHIPDRLPAVGAIDHGSLFDFPGDILQAGHIQQHV